MADRGECFNCNTITNVIEVVNPYETFFARSKHGRIMLCNSCLGALDE